jgi:hypothetical protein
MARRRRLKVAYLLGSLLLLGASLHAPTAYAAAGDPPSGSPAGAVYELPLEQGRADGAPKGSGGTGAGAGGGGGSTVQGGGGDSTGEQGEAGSLYRSENNFGSSSQVPGVAAAGVGVDGGGGGGGGAGSLGGAAAGGVAGAAGAAIAGAAVANRVPDAGNTSVSASIVLLGAVALLAAAVGVLSRRFSGGRAGS